jgi:hypothetical protein
MKSSKLYVQVGEVYNIFTEVDNTPYVWFMGKEVFREFGYSRAAKAYNKYSPNRILLRYHDLICCGCPDLHPRGTYIIPDTDLYMTAVTVKFPAMIQCVNRIRNALPNTANDDFENMIQQLVQDTSLHKQQHPKLRLIYVLQNQQTGAVKVGISTNAEQRRSRIQCQAGMEIVTLYESPLSTHAVQLEKQIFEQFRFYRTIGEWFNIDPTIVILYIKAEMEKLLPAPQSEVLVDGPKQESKQEQLKLF